MAERHLAKQWREAKFKREESYLLALHPSVRTGTRLWRRGDDVLLEFGGNLQCDIIGGGAVGLFLELRFI